MCAAVVSAPLREPQHYDPTFKVEVCLSLPLWPSDRAVYEVMSLCGLLEVLCKKEMQQHSKDSKSTAAVSLAFKDKAQIVVEQLYKLSPRLPQGDLLGYLHSLGLNQLFPRAVAFTSNPSTLPSNINWSPLDDHQESLAALQLVQGMAKQLNSDLMSLDNHKYIAHQLALLHQSVNALNKMPYMGDFKQTIEGNFQEIKNSINNAHDSGETPHLPAHLKQWLQELTSQIIHVCHNPPSQVIDCLQPAAQALR